MTTAERCPVQQFTMLAGVQDEDPFEVYDAVGNVPPFWTDSPNDVDGFWVVTRYADVRAILQDAATFSSIDAFIPRIAMPNPMLPTLLSFYERPFVPPWLAFRQRIKAIAKAVYTGRVHPSTLPWDTGGSAALTYLAKRHGLYHLALPPGAFYPKHWTEADWILDPAMRLEDVLTPESVAVHVFNQKIRSFKDRPAPAGPARRPSSPASGR